MSFIQQIARPVHSEIKRKLAISRLKNAARQPETRIVVGASDIYEEGWAPTEQSYLDLLKIADWQRFFQLESVNAILAEHVWEHLSEDEGFEAACNCYDYLKKGGYLRVAVPDGYHPDKNYIDYVRPGGKGLGADDHKVLYNYQTFSKLFEYAGFTINLLEYFDENGKFHYVDWKPEDGIINRSRRYDSRNQDGKLRYTSLIVDAVKGLD